jgi:anti-sigma-K factor RskA
MRPGTGQGADVIELSQRLKRWRAAAVLTGALAACLLALVVVQETNPDLLPVPLQPKTKTVEVANTVEVPSPRPAEFVAVLQRDAASPAFIVTVDVLRRHMTVRRVSAEPETGKSYELWLVNDELKTPRSLGIVGDKPFTVVGPQLASYSPKVIEDATLAVSLEPEGGSPTGAPTGPVLFAGKLIQTTK